MALKLSTARKSNNISIYYSTSWGTHETINIDGCRNNIEVIIKKRCGNWDSNQGIKKLSLSKVDNISQKLIRNSDLAKFECLPIEYYKDGTTK